MSSPVLNKVDERIFSPIEVRESPARSTPQRGNLTGNPRKIRDSAADVYNFIQEWKNQNVKGFDILKKIHLLKSSSLTETGTNNPEKIYPVGLQNLCDDLDIICEALKALTSKMAACSTEVAAVVKLESLKRCTDDTPLFVTWPACRFGEAWSEITAAYEKELKLKVYIKENVAHTVSEDILTFYLASWAHEPYIARSIDLTLDALLKETGHR